MVRQMGQPTSSLIGANLAREEDSNSPQLPASSSLSPDEMVVESSTEAPLDDFRSHQDLLKRVVSNLGLKIEELNESADELFEILASAAPSRVALPMHEEVV